jgi:membrane protease YdiL (CAAX protease family)
MTLRNAALRILAALAIALAISLAALQFTNLWPVPEDGWVPSSFVTHTSMWGISVLLISILTRGNFGRYGFTRGTYRFTPKIFLWVIPTSVLSVMGYLASRWVEAVPELTEFSYLQDVLFIWAYASISEEIFTRGLLLGFLSDLRAYGINLLGRWRLSAPVLFSAFYFGGMHVVLRGTMGSGVVSVIVLATLLGMVTGYYRERTGSLIPAIIIHVLFNIGGMLPMWLLSSLL